MFFRTLGSKHASHFFAAHYRVGWALKKMQKNDNSGKKCGDSGCLLVSMPIIAGNRNATLNVRFRRLPFALYLWQSISSVNSSNLPVCCPPHSSWLTHKLSVTPAVAPSLLVSQLLRGGSQINKSNKLYLTNVSKQRALCPLSYILPRETDGTWAKYETGPVSPKLQQIYTVRRVSGGYAAREDVLIHKFDTRVKALFLLSPAAAVAACRMAKFDERNATTPACGPRQSCRVELWPQTPKIIGVGLGYAFSIHASCCARWSSFHCNAAQWFW